MWWTDGEQQILVGWVDAAIPTMRRPTLLVGLAASTHPTFRSPRRRRHDHLRGADDAVVHLVAGFDGVEDGHRRVVGRRLLHDGLVLVRVEEFMLRFDGDDAELRERVGELAADDLDALYERRRRLVAFRGVERPFEVVHHRQEL